MQPSRNDSARAARRAVRASVALALASLAALLLWSYVTSEPVGTARTLVAAMAVLTLASPAAGLLVCAGLLPLTGPLSALLGTQSAFSIGEPFVLAFLAAWLVRAAGWAAAPDVTRRRFLAPAVVLALVVAASAAVQVVNVLAAVADSERPAPGVLHFIVTDYFRSRAPFGAIPAAAFFLEGLGLFAAAVSIGRRVDGFGGRLLATVAVGATGVGALSIVRLITVSLRQSDAWTAMLQHLGTIRISAAFPDPNAAGSYLAMGLLAATGVAVEALDPAQGASGGRRTRRSSALWLAAVPVIASGLWLTGSRAAILAAAAASIVLVPLARRAPRWLRLGGAAAIAIALVAALPFAAQRLNPPTGSGRALPRAFSIRVEMTRTAGRMIGAHPLFGVGIGQFYDRSAEYVTPAFRRVVSRENAHNNFLQILAELGVAGFVPFAWVLGAVAWSALRSWHSGRARAAGTGGAAGLVAFVLTWFAGHPLLIFEVATAFWLVLGAVAALATTGEAGSEGGEADRAR